MKLSNRIALFVPDLADGGAQRVMLNLACGLADQGVGVDLVVARATGSFLSQVPSSVCLVNLNAKRASTSVVALSNYLRRERPAALLSALERSNIVALLARFISGVPTRVVLSIHNTVSVDCRRNRTLKSQLMPYFVRIFYRWADAIVAVSGGAADDLASLTTIPRSRITVIYNPVIDADMQKALLEPLDHPWFDYGQPPVVLSVGRLRPQKDYETLLEAFQRVRAHRLARLVILGEGPERQKLESCANRLGISDDVAMPGFVSNPYAYMARSGVFALSSQWEGLPTVLIEALACGLPVVSTDCPSGPREILDNGRHGRLVPISDPTALASAIEATLDEERTALSDEVWEPFLTSSATDRYLSVLMES